VSIVTADESTNPLLMVEATAVPIIAPNKFQHAAHTIA
jgi:hypothetical protein